jgi:pimeloyl-ACP methyl ester carboxylesterase
MKMLLPSTTVSHPLELRTAAGASRQAVHGRARSTRARQRGHRLRCPGRRSSSGTRDPRRRLLLVCGDQDPYYPKEIYQETARLIPDCTLRMYEGKGHEVDKGLAEDVLDFVRQQPAAAPGHATEPPGEQ